MKERPILFSGAMVRAILEGRKTQTRRVVKPQPHENIDRLHGGKLRERFPYTLIDEEDNYCGEGFQDERGQFWKCPYGQPGERLWVRETFATGYGGVFYRASEGDKCKVISGAIVPWKPSIHMPRKLSRLTLEIVRVRVERLQDITEEDAIAEGVEPSMCPAYVQVVQTDGNSYSFGVGGIHVVPKVGERDEFGKEVAFVQTVPAKEISTAKQAFMGLWARINGWESWQQNPWVWVVEFKQVQGAGGKLQVETAKPVT